MEQTDEYVLLVPAPGSGREDSAVEWVNCQLEALADEYQERFMVRVGVKACDECGALDGGANGEVHTYVITLPDGRAKGDLCDVHAKPILDLIGRLPASATSSAQRRTFRVVDDAEIDRQKRTSQKRRPARKGGRA